MDSIRSNRFWFLVGFILLAVAIRIALVDVPNVKPIAAMCLFGAAYFRSKWIGLILPLTALFLSDLIQQLLIPSRGFYGELMLFTYGAFALIAFVGFLLRGRVTVPRLLLASLSGAVIFFLISNLGVWALGDYARDFSGLLTSYEMAIPFFKWTVLGDLGFVSVLFGCWELAKRRLPSLALAR
jgi:hypothetical protein